VGDALLKYETLSGDDVHRLMRGEILTKPSVADMLVAQAQRARDASQPKVGNGETTELPPNALPA